MTAVQVTLNQLPSALRQMEGNIRAAIKRGIRSGAQAGKALLIHSSPVDQGELKASWRVVNTTEDGPGGVTLRNSAPHAGIVEMGARPHTVNAEGVQAIQDWVNRHFPGKTDEEQADIAERIVYKLQHYGQKPTYFVKNALPMLQHLGLAEVAAALAKVEPGMPKGRK